MRMLLPRLLPKLLPSLLLFLLVLLLPPRAAMRWTSVMSGFVLRHMCELISLLELGR
jgi:hypothetical protein